MLRRRTDPSGLTGVALAVLLLGFVGAGCAQDDTAGTAETDTQEETQTATNRNIEIVVAEQSPTLMVIPGVVAVSQSMTADGQPAIRVMLARDDAEARARIPTTIEGFPVIVEVSGDIKAMPDTGR